MTQAISLAGYKKLTKLVQDDAEWLTKTRRESLAAIRSNRSIWARDTAIVAYLEARKQLGDRKTELASRHPEKAANWSQNARIRNFGI